MDKALLVGIILPHNNKTDIDNHLSELSMLADTADVEVLGEITQQLSKVNPAFILVKGKQSRS